MPAEGSLHILLVEDSPLDAELTVATLADGGLQFRTSRVDTEEALVRALETERFDLVVSDYALPAFSGRLALEITRKLRPDLPFIFLSGAIGEDTAVELLKSGATDVVLKHNPERLVPSLRRAVREEEERRRRLEVERERDRLLEREKTLRLEAEAASRAKDEFLALVSHELRTPLNAILGWAVLLRAGRVFSEEQTESFDVIERNAKVLAQLVDDLIDLSRITSARLELEVRPTRLPEVIDAAIDASRLAADARGVRIVRRVADNLPPMPADPARLQQVVWNLVSNAVKFTPAGGVIEVVLAREGPHAKISVSDSGQGIAPDFIPCVFDHFRQGDASSRRAVGGLGLGLTIVKHLVELHGGTITAQSAGLGMGSVFTVLLPLHAVASDDAGRHAGSGRSTARSHMPDLRGRRILVVEDEPDALELAQRILRQTGAEVRGAASMADAMRALHGFTPDVLVSDIAMPEEDGYDLVRALRRLEDQGRPRIAAIALTAFASLEDQRNALSAGFDRHLSKPVAPLDLAWVVADLITGRTAGARDGSPHPAASVER